MVCPQAKRALHHPRQGAVGSDDGVRAANEPALPPGLTACRCCAPFLPWAAARPIAGAQVDVLDLRQAPKPASSVQTGPALAAEPVLPMILVRCAAPVARSFVSVVTSPLRGSGAVGLLRVCSYMYNSVAGLNPRTVAVLQESYAMLGKVHGAYSSTPGFLEYLCMW
jgi:hypothetical protein